MAQATAATAVKDLECIAFLQWALPRLQLGWPGYRKVRRQVCKRVDRRVQALGSGSVDAYRARLETDPAEWADFDVKAQPGLRVYRRV